MARVVVLGGGFGGVPAALRLRERLRPEDEVVLVDEAPTFRMGLVNLWALDGRTAGDEHARPLAALAQRGVRVVQARVSRIDVASRRVETTAGALPYDQLIVALGATLAPERLPGLPPQARDLYSLDGARRLHEDLARLRGGRVLLLVHAMPFKCPPAPYEAAMLARAFLRARGVEADVTLATPEPHPLPVFGPETGAFLRKVAKERGVVVRNGLTVERVESGAVSFQGGERLPFDVLAVVPAHVPPAAVAALSGGGFLPVDARTLATTHEGVWGVGDCTALKLENGKMLPKAGVLAEGEALVAADNAAAALRGDAPTASFDGRGTCFIELGDGLAIEGRGDFFARPQPVMTPSAPSRDAMRAKEAFMHDRLRAWFGA